MKYFLEANEAAGRQFYLDYHQKGKVVMLNLLKFREKADYSGHMEIRPSQEITGEEAYHLYIEETLPELTKAGGRILYFGKSSHFLIGPESESWDAILLVEHSSAIEFIAFAQNKNYLKIAGHRTAALEDSRLLPSTEWHFSD